MEVKKIDTNNSERNVSYFLSLNLCYLPTETRTLDEASILKAQLSNKTLQLLFFENLILHPLKALHHSALFCAPAAAP